MNQRSTRTTLLAVISPLLTGLVAWCAVDVHCDEEEFMASISKPGQGHTAPGQTIPPGQGHERKIPRRIEDPVPPKPGPITTAPGSPSRGTLPPFNKKGSR